MIKGSWRLDGKWFTVAKKRFCYIVRDCHIKDYEDNILEERKFISPKECRKFNIDTITLSASQAGITILLNSPEGKVVIWKGFPDWHKIQYLLTGSELCDFYRDPLIVSEGDARYEKLKEYYEYYRHIDGGKK